MRLKNTETKKRTEANARRKVAKRWEIVSGGCKYKHAAARESSKMVALQIKGEMFDGILLSLSSRNEKYSQKRKKRLLRRIVEKRQAQAAFKRVGRSENLFTSRLIEECSCRCMHELHRYQNCI